MRHSPLLNFLLCLWFLTSISSMVWADAKSNQKIQKQEAICQQRNWEKITFNINGVERNVFYKSPVDNWKRGIILALHGGAGNYTNWCGTGNLIEPMVEFSQMALKSGFAILAIDSSPEVFSDESGKSCGKRYDFTVQGKLANPEIPFFEQIFNELIPRLRPKGSSKNVFMAGISNGGYMTLRASTHFDDKIKAFALVSCGDPYGTHVDCREGLSPRQNAPGVFIDNESNKEIKEDNACLASEYPNEKQWETSNPPVKPVFKQFHHLRDGVIDLSCAKKAQTLLKEHGYADAGPFYANSISKRKRIVNHFWLDKYNPVLIKFFVAQSQTK